MIAKNTLMEEKAPARRSPTKQSVPQVGEVRRFGKFGPVYIIRKITGDSCSVEIPENGQTASIALEQISSDPIER